MIDDRVYLSYIVVLGSEISPINIRKYCRIYRAALVSNRIPSASEVDIQIIIARAKLLREVDRVHLGFHALENFIVTNLSIKIGMVERLCAKMLNYRESVHLRSQLRNLRLDK